MPPGAEHRTYRVHQRVYYQDAHGRRHRAKVVAVHLDDVQPYYTVRLYRGERELETVASRIWAIRAEPP